MLRRGRRDLAVRMNDVLHADGAEKNGVGRVGQEFDGEIALSNVAQLAWDDPPAFEGGEVGAGGAFSGGAARRRSRRLAG